MREIKFRGQRIDNEEWVYGFYNYVFERGYNSQSYDDVPNRCHYIDTDTNYYEIKGHTVGQYTGLKDENGVEIYEGDLLESNLSWDGQVEFAKGSFKVNGMPLANLNYMEIRNYKE